MSITRRSFVRLAGVGTLSAALSEMSHSVEPKNNQNILSNDKKGDRIVAVPDKNIYLKRVISALKRQWPDNRTVNIVCHGHSVPAGFFKTPLVDTFNAYPHLLHKGLKENYPYCVCNVIVTAIGGETSQSGDERFETYVLCHRPDVVTIDYALNDRGIGLKDARLHWVSMIEKAVSQRVLVLLLTPTPDMDHKPDDPNEPLNQHADQIRALAAEYEVGLVDSLAGFDQYQKETGNVSDLLSQINHPNRKGHDIVAERLLSWFSDDPSPVGVGKWNSF
ncbi:MAG: SGNH/GDSL hydrolase family protein [bacterium]